MKLHQVAGANNLFWYHIQQWHRLLQADGAISSWVLKWYHSHIIALLRLVRSRHILSLRFPCLSLPSTSSKVLIQGVDWFTGFKLLLVLSGQSPSWKLLSNAQGLVNRGFGLTWHWDPPGYGMGDQQSNKYHQQHQNNSQEFVSGL